MTKNERAHGIWGMAVAVLSMAMAMTLCPEWAFMWLGFLNGGVFMYNLMTITILARVRDQLDRCVGLADGFSKITEQAVSQCKEMADREAKARTIKRVEP